MQNGQFGREALRLFRNPPPPSPTTIPHPVSLVAVQAANVLKRPGFDGHESLPLPIDPSSDAIPAR